MDDISKMKITVERHVFGSFKGYTTLSCSDTLSPDEIKELEILSFGQTGSSDYIDSLDTNIAYISRPIGNSKWAITRVFKGQPDDHNRITLLFISTILSTGDWVNVLNCDISILFERKQLWQWEQEKKLSNSEILLKDNNLEIPDSKIRQKAISLLSLVEKNWNSKQRCILCFESDCDFQTVRFLNLILPNSVKKSFSYAYRALNDAVPVFLINMASNGNSGNSKKTIIKWDPKSDGAGANYANYISNIWKPNESLPAEVINKIPNFIYDEEVVDSQNDWVEDIKYTNVEKTFSHSDFKSKRSITVKSILVMVSIIIIVLAGFVTKGILDKNKIKKEVSQKMSSVQTFISQLKDPCDYENPDDIENVANELRRDMVPINKYRDLDPNNATLNDLLSKIKVKLDEFAETEGLMKNIDSLEVEFNYQHQKMSLLQNYPESKRVSDLLNLEENITISRNSADVKLHEIYASKFNSILDGINDLKRQFSQLLRKVIDDINSKLKDFYDEKIKAYSEQDNQTQLNHEKLCKDWLSDKTINNACNSPIPEDNSEALTIKSILDKKLKQCQDNFTELRLYKENATKYIKDANAIFNDPNISDGNIDNINKYIKINTLLSDANANWPDNEKMQDLTKQNKNKYIENYNALLVKIDADPNAIEVINNAIKVYNSNQKELNVISVKAQEHLDFLQMKLKEFKKVIPEPNMPKTNEQLLDTNNILDKDKMLQKTQQFQSSYNWSVDFEKEINKVISNLNRKIDTKIDATDKDKQKIRKEVDIEVGLLKNYLMQIIEESKKIEAIKDNRISFYLSAKANLDRADMNINGCLNSEKLKTFFKENAEEKK